LTADPHNEQALRLRVFAFLVLARFADDRADIDQLLKLKPDDKQMLGERAVASVGLTQLGPTPIMRSASTRTTLSPISAEARSTV